MSEIWYKFRPVKLVPQVASGMQLIDLDRLDASMSELTDLVENDEIAFYDIHPATRPPETKA